jgi:hypothetical protein
MNHILSRIVTRANSVTYFLDLLDLLGKECPQTLIETENMSKVRGGRGGGTVWVFVGLSLPS